MPDAIVIGSGPNGLVAANVLADAGWRVQVLEARPEPGGAVRSDRGVDHAFVSDVFSAFYPLAAASPVIQGLHLEEYGLTWRRAPAVLAHPLADSRCAVLREGAQNTAAGLADAFGAADARAWLRMSELWDEIGRALLDTMFAPFPPSRRAVALARRLTAAGFLETARFLALPARAMVEEAFTELGPKMLIAGCALHVDLLPEAAGSGAMGWVMAMIGQQHGWPVPVGGASELTAALVRRLRARGGSVHCDTQVTEVVVHDGRARGVRTADGARHEATRAVLADVAVPSLYGGLVGWEHLPRSIRAGLRRFGWDPATFKVDWALRGPIPWRAGGAAQAGTVHLGSDLNELSDFALQVATGRVPRDLFAILGQMTTADPSRSPAGTESAWAYTHLPRRITADLGGDLTGRWDEGEADAMADRLEQRVEQYAPGFRDLVAARRVLSPAKLEEMNANLFGGALGGGTAQPHQQLVLRPLPGLGRPETPIERLYLASAAAHPGGGVHGACGANAARAALRAHTLVGRRIVVPALAAADRLLNRRPRAKQGT